MLSPVSPLTSTASSKENPINSPAFDESSQQFLGKGSSPELRPYKLRTDYYRTSLELMRALSSDSFDKKTVESLLLKQNSAARALGSADFIDSNLSMLTVFYNAQGDTAKSTSYFSQLSPENQESLMSFVKNDVFGDGSAHKPVPTSPASPIADLEGHPSKYGKELSRMDFSYKNPDYGTFSYNPEEGFFGAQQSFKLSNKSVFSGSGVEGKASYKVSNNLFNAATEVFGDNKLRDVALATVLLESGGSGANALTTGKDRSYGLLQYNLLSDFDGRVSNLRKHGIISESEQRDLMKRKSLILSNGYTDKFLTERLNDPSTYKAQFEIMGELIRSKSGFGHWSVALESGSAKIKDRMRSYNINPEVYNYENIKDITRQYVGRG